jgi:hypothetical protein
MTPDQRSMLVLPAWSETFSLLQRQFLSAYSLGGSISHACAVLEMSRANPYRWRESCELFVDAMEEARELGIQRLEDWALSRAMDKANPSDRLTEFLLKAARPEIYRERVDHRISGAVESRKRIILEELDSDRVIPSSSVRGGVLAEGGGDVVLPVVVDVAGEESGGGDVTV